MPVTTLNAIAQSSAERLVNSTVEGVLLALLVWLVLRLVPRQNAGTRFSLWMAALLSIATLPVAEALARVDRPITAAVSHAALTVPAGWGTALFAPWAMIALMLLARVLVGVMQLVAVAQLGARKSTSLSLDRAAAPDARRLSATSPGCAVRLGSRFGANGRWLVPRRPLCCRRGHCRSSRPPI